MNSNILGEKDGFLIRLAKAEDAAGYFEQNFCPLDQEVVRLTGCKEEFTKDEPELFSGECRPEPDGAECDFLQR